MDVLAPQGNVAAGRRSHRPALALAAAAALCLVGAGLLLWARHGSAVFGDMVVTALAWCF
jgi:hypothetical protein